MADKINFTNEDSDGNEYEASDSENEYSEDEKELLRDVRKGRRKEEDTENAVMAFDDSDDDDDDDNDDEDDVDELMRDSDIEGAEDNDEHMPNEMDWGNKARNYYHTDFVDPDYSSYTEKEQELAKLEEEEAKSIQTRLLKRMKEADFLPELYLGGDDKDAKNKRDAGKILQDDTIIVKADLKGLSKQEQLKLFNRESPEFFGLIAEFEEFLEEISTLISPVLRYAKKNNVPKIPALQFAEHYQNILLTYCSNLSFYLVLKANRISIKTHPITIRLLQLKKHLQELKDKYDNIIEPQLQALLERIMDGDIFEVLDNESKPSKPSKPKMDVNKKKTQLSAVPAQSSESDDASNDENQGEDDEEAEEGEADINGGDIEERRKITYQMAKNKGLTPARKKEARNPRVKHRGKFRKALIRRKGAVRTVRKETRRYDGEMSGIKAGVVKSIKFKV